MFAASAFKERSTGDLPTPPATSSDLRSHTVASRGSLNTKAPPANAIAKKDTDITAARIFLVQFTALNACNKLNIHLEARSVSGFVLALIWVFGFRPNAAPPPVSVSVASRLNLLPHPCIARSPPCILRIHYNKIIIIIVEPLRVYFPHQKLKPPPESSIKHTNAYMNKKNKHPPSFPNTIQYYMKKRRGEKRREEKEWKRSNTHQL